MVYMVFCNTLDIYESEEWKEPLVESTVIKMSDRWPSPLLCLGIWPHSRLWLLLYTATKMPIYVFPEKELRGLSPNFYIKMSVSDIYSQNRSTYFPTAE